MFKFAEVGGAVRDQLLGIKSKDIDFVAIPNAYLKQATIEVAFSALVEELKSQNFVIFLETPEYVTVRAKVPEGHPLRSRTDVADFVLARRDGPSSDGRRPDYVLPGSLYDDLARRDFTVNAISILDGNFVDPHDGLKDLENRILRFVGEPEKRINEDGLRVLRFFRFLITKKFEPDSLSYAACLTVDSAEMVERISIERISAELDKMLKTDTIGSLLLLSKLPDYLLSAIFRNNLHLVSSLKQL